MVSWMTTDAIGDTNDNDGKTGCRFITVDAYRHAVPFYLKNDFQFMGKEEELRYHTGKDTTIALYFDLYSIV